MTEREIFTAALNLAEPADRAAYLSQTCAGDAGLRQRVETLLAEHEQLGSFLETPGSDATLDMRVSERAGAQIGPYKLLQQIGEGGFGVVFMAEQLEPVRRKVALKVIKPGMDTRQVIARFEAERQALAMMDHPNIAKVLDAGTTGEMRTVECEMRNEKGLSPSIPHSTFPFPHSMGRPYFVMELVRGVPITAYCDENNLPVRERLELFATVCQAIQHAHTKGIIHRDIKPSNVLVTRQDGRPVVKVIDFGVAKAMGQQLTEKTLFTEFAQMVGTPLYMSPEQAELSSEDIDTRSDIYSLGVLLYELLTGTTPVNGEQMKKAAFDEIRRIIREDEPQKPSTRISAAKAGPSIAAHRRTEPAKLARLMRGELDWIVMKCLEKDRNRRYNTANSLIADVQRYLSDEAVQACPPSAWYRFRKFARRNLGAFVAASGLALVLLLAVIALAASNVLIRQEQARTQVEKRRAENAQQLARDHAEKIQQDMDDLKAANAMLDRGRWYMYRREWDDAHASLTKAVQLRPDHVSVWAERADLYLRLGLWDLAAADFARSVESSEPDVTSRWHQHALLRLAVGDTDGYRAACRTMRERFRGSTKESIVEVVLRSSALAPSRDEELRPLRELTQKLGGRPWSSYALYIVGTAHYRAGQEEQAIQRLRESLAATDESVRLLSYPVLAMAYHRLGRAAEAREALDQAARVLEQWTQQRCEGHRECTVEHQGVEGAWPVAWWDYLEGQLFYREAKLLIEGFPPPDDPRLHVLRARSFVGLGWPEKAAPEYAAALKLSPQDPQIALEAHRNRGYSYVWSVLPPNPTSQEARRHREDSGSDRGPWSKAAAEFAKASELHPDDSYLWRYRAVACLAAGDLDAYRLICAAMLDRFEKTDDPLAAGNVLLVCTLRDDALTDMARLLPLTCVADRVWHWGVWARGAALYRAGKFEESVKCFEEEATMYRPKAWEWCFLAMAHHRLGHADEARRCLAAAGPWIAAADRREFDDPTGTRPSWGNWHERVVYPLLLREAEDVLKQESGVRDQGT